MQDRRGSRTALSEFALFGSNWRKLELKPATIWKWSLVAVISVVSYRAKNIDNYHRTRTRSPLQILSVKDFVIVKCLPPLKKDWSLPFLVGLQMQIANADSAEHSKWLTHWEFWMGSSCFGKDTGERAFFSPKQRQKRAEESRLSRSSVYSINARNTRPFASSAKSTISYPALGCVEFFKFSNIFENPKEQPFWFRIPERRVAQVHRLLLEFKRAQSKQSKLFLCFLNSFAFTVRHFNLKLPWTD